MGRKRVHQSSKCRKAAFYAQHREEERQKARDRMRRLRAQRAHQKQRHSELQAEVIHRLPRLAQITDGSLKIYESSRLDRVWHALRAEMTQWRERETDAEQFEDLTVFAIDLQCAARPKTDFEDALLPRTVLLQTLLEIAQDARAEAERRDPANAAYVGSLCTALGVVATDIAHVIDSLKELVEFYDGHEPGMLRLMYDTKLLHWQMA